MDRPIWLVNAADVGEVHQLTPAQASRMHLNNMYSAPDALYIGCILAQRNLPIDVVNAILEAAGVVLEARAEMRMKAYGYAPLDEEILRLDVPVMDYKWLELVRPVALILESISHDQGWASDAPELNGSYNGCWSWIEFQVAAADGTLVVDRRPMCRNFRANRSPRRHLQYVTDSDVLATLAPGRHISMHMRAQFGGWANFVQYARVSVVMAVGICEDVDVGATWRMLQRERQAAAVSQRNQCVVS
ncbi:hypothetical protein ACHHYP_04526 [Achlya hypogyna]|uniref:Uncharacterized protein n=1 Tax=Achlya hypogyna TaxID=1202772 RepID=A0A1V9Z140_ACHHY|nr:hypothetical protein ACHHYP_04526 [Achlya hypogyna]